MFQKVTGRLAGVDKGTVSRVVREVAALLCSKSRDFIRMPDRSEMRLLADANRDRFGFGNTPVAVDGCLIELRGQPQEDELPEGYIPQDFWEDFQPTYCSLGNFFGPPFFE